MVFPEVDIQANSSQSQTVPFSEKLQKKSQDSNAVAGP